MEDSTRSKLSVIRTHNDLISRQSTSNWSWIIRRLFWLTIPVFYWAKRGALYIGREKAAIKVRPRRSPNNLSRFTSAGNCWRFEFPNFNGSSDATKDSRFGASKRSHKASTNFPVAVDLFGLELIYVAMHDNERDGDVSGIRITTKLESLDATENGLMGRRWQMDAKARLMTLRLEVEHFKSSSHLRLPRRESSFVKGSISRRICIVHGWLLGDNSFYALIDFSFIKKNLHNKFPFPLLLIDSRRINWFDLCGEQVWTNATWRLKVGRGIDVR